MTALKGKVAVIFSAVWKKSSNKRQSNYPTKMLYELNYNDTDPDIVIDCVILKIIKIKLWART